MHDSQQWWEEFWAEQGPGNLTKNGHGATCWNDLVWRVNLEYWRDLFDKQAPGRKMLECGCGSAKLSQFMAHNGYQCSLLDYSENALHQGKKAFSAQSLSGDFYIGDMSQLCFPDNSFDIVFSGGVLEFFDDVRKPIGEMVRVLKPGGIFASNMVPRKISIQTIADFERTLVYSCRNLVKGRFSEVFRRVESVPRHFGVNPMPLQGYIDVCRQTQLESVVGLVMTPFPNLALPKVGKILYARFMSEMMPFWQKFNVSKRRWTEICGILYTIYGTKK
jgi:ubiquinone/menaquinone biosynthesis C-methylase UbiE